MSDNITTTAVEPQETEQPSIDYKAELEKLQGKYEGLQKDLHKHRTRADELTAAKQAAEEKALAERELSEQVQAWQEKYKQLEADMNATKQQAQRANWKVELSQHVNDANAALRLLDPEKHVTGEGVNITALLEDYPILKPSAASVGGGSRQAESNPDQARKLDITKMSKAEINAHWDEIMNRS